MYWSDGRLGRGRILDPLPFVVHPTPLLSHTRLVRIQARFLYVGVGEQLFNVVGYAGEHVRRV